MLLRPFSALDRIEGTPRERERERERENNKGLYIQSRPSRAPAVRAARRERAGHLGSAGDDSLAARRRIKRRSKQNSERSLQQQASKITEKKKR